jgi:hypothetical protein
MPESILRITGRTATRVQSKHATAVRELEQAVSDLTPEEIRELARFLTDPLNIEWFGVRAHLYARQHHDDEQLFAAYYHTKGLIVTVEKPPVPCVPRTS